MTTTARRTVDFGSLELTDIVRYAGASGDLNPIHHDDAAGRAAGHGGVISMGMLHGGRLLSELLSGPDADPGLGLGPHTVYLRFTGVVRPGQALAAEVAAGTDGLHAELTAAGRPAVTAKVRAGAVTAGPDRSGAEVHTATFPVEWGAARRFAAAVDWHRPVAVGDPVPPTFLATVSSWLPVAGPIERAGFDPARTVHGESEVALVRGPIRVGETLTVAEFVAGRRVKEGRSGRMTVVDVVAELTDASGLRAVYRTTLLETAAPPGTAGPPAAGPFRLRGSRDPRTGEVFFPERELSVDGELRACEPVVLADRGVLWSWTTYDGQDYGQLDLPEGVRVQARLGAGEHVIGAAYTLAGTAEAWWFDRA